MGADERIPSHTDLMNPLIQALHDLGGSGTIDEINQRVGEILDVPDEVLEIPHDPETTSRSEVEYRLAWARTYLKKYGLLENSSRGVWAIKPDKRNVTRVDPDDVSRAMREHLEAKKEEKTVQSAGEDVPAEDESWHSVLHRLLVEEMSPDAFERLTKRLLRESGFVQVEVTGRSGDGGIDGRGIMRIGGLLSFHVLFQCKRYQGSVSPAQIRDFRGAMIGRADKGLFVTTGTFTRGAVEEATRGGAPPIDLVDGDQLAEKLKELGLGVETEVVERVRVDEEWFEQI
jgi:restriction system protein